MKKNALIILALLAASASAQLITSTNVRKAQALKFKAGDRIEITVNGASFVDYTVPAGTAFSGSINFNGTAQ